MRKTKISHKYEQKFEDITRLIAENLDLENPLIEKAFRKFTQDCSNSAQKTYPADAEQKELNAPETKKAIIDYYRSVIALTAAKLAFEGAEANSEYLLKRLKEAIDEHEDLDSGSWELDLIRFRAIASDEETNSENPEAIANVAKSILTLTDEQLKQVSENEILPGFIAKDVERGGVTKDYALHLAKFVIENGVEGRKQVEEILKNEQKTQYAAHDPAAEVPVLTFLANQVILTKKVEANQVN